MKGQIKSTLNQQACIKALMRVDQAKDVPQYCSKWKTDCLSEWESGVMYMYRVTVYHTPWRTVQFNFTNPLNCNSIILNVRVHYVMLFRNRFRLEIIGISTLA